VTWLNGLQLALAASAVIVIARRMHVLLFVAPLDIKPFVSALDSALAARQPGLAQALARACAPSWPAQLADGALAQLERGAPVQEALDDAQLDLEAATSRGLGALVAFGRMANPLAFIGVMLELGRAFGQGQGLLGLQRGLVASSAMERSLFTFALGVATFAVCFVAATILQRRARRLRDDLHRVASVVAESAVQ
jgi:hypothetical protein